MLWQIAWISCLGMLGSYSDPLALRRPQQTPENADDGTGASTEADVELWTPWTPMSFLLFFRVFPFCIFPWLSMSECRYRASPQQCSILQEKTAGGAGEVRHDRHLCRQHEMYVSILARDATVKQTAAPSSHNYFSLRNTFSYFSHAMLAHLNRTPTKETLVVLC